MIETSLFIAAILMGVGAFCGIIRLMSGPYLTDRVVSLDYLTFVAIGAMGLFSVYFSEALYLDIAITVALLGFLATIAFARYAENLPKTGKDEEDMDD